VIVFINIHFKP